MPRQSRVRSRWGIGAIRLARAAAFVVLATGIAEALALAMPRADALYVYLGAIALLAWLEGVGIAAVAVAFAAAAYPILFNGNALMLAGAG